MKRDKSQAWTANYPPLDEWLRAHEMRCHWQEWLGDPTAEPARGHVECWITSTGRQCIITVWPNQMGWEIYTPTDSRTIDDTLRDAEARLGLAEDLSASDAAQADALAAVEAVKASARDDATAAAYTATKAVRS